MTREGMRRRMVDQFGQCVTPGCGAPAVCGDQCYGCAERSYECAQESAMLDAWSAERATRAPRWYEQVGDYALLFLVLGGIAWFFLETAPWWIRFVAGWRHELPWSE